MSNSWFRSWHGAPTDPKWLAITQRTQANASERDRTLINAGTVSAVWWALLDHASQANPRGSVESFDVESYAAFSGFQASVVQAIIDSMKEKNLIISGRLAEWDKRQPKREDGSSERAKEWRERKRTQPNANEHREEKIREEDKKDAAPSRAPSDERDLFDRGKQVLGKNAGGVIAQLLKAKGGSPALARAAIEQASEKQNPREYIGKIIRAPKSEVAEPPDWDRAVREFRDTNGNRWPMKLGPEPGYGGCRAPPELLQKYNIDPATGRVMA